MTDQPELEESTPPHGPRTSPPIGETKQEPQGAPPPAPRTLRRSRDDRVIAGVCGGLAEYLGVDAVLVRIAAVILVFAGGAGILLYVIGWVAMPDAPEVLDGEAATSTARAEPTERASGAVVLGLVFVVLGVFFLVDEVWPDFLSWKYVWPIALIAVGAAILLRARR